MTFRKRLLSLSIVALAAGVVVSASVQAPPTTAAKKVWTEEDLIALRGISPVMDSRLRAAVPATPAPQNPARYTKFKDPRWYREGLEPLRAELARTNAALRRLRNALKSGKGGTNAIDLDWDVEGITPESEVALLVKHRAEILRQIDTIEDLAQKNEILPGELRKERSAEELAYSAYLDAAARDTPEPEKLQTEAQWRQRFAELREQLGYAQRELSVLVREWNMGLVQYYPNPNKAMREQYTRRELSKLAQKIRDKKSEIARLKQTISDLEDDLRHAGGPPGWSRE